MSSTEGQQGLLRVLGGIVFFTAGLVALSLLATHPSEESASSITAIARAPASLVGMALTPSRAAVPLLERTSVLEFECAPPVNATIAPETKQLRLKGKLCGDSKDGTAKIVNVTNGSTATVFQSSPGHFTSDFIHLSDGQNLLRVSYFVGDVAKKTEEFQVFRTGDVIPSK